MLHKRDGVSAMQDVGLLTLQAGDVSNAADFARAKRHKKLSARLNSAAARSKMTWLKRHAIYVLLFLIVTHTAGFIATRVLLASEKSHVASVRTYLRLKMLSTVLVALKAQPSCLPTFARYHFENICLCSAVLSAERCARLALHSS